MRFKVSKKYHAPQLEPCVDCDIPPRFVLNYKPGPEGEMNRCDVECRDCGDAWTEILDEIE